MLVHKRLAVFGTLVVILVGIAVVRADSPKLAEPAAKEFVKIDVRGKAPSRKAVLLNKSTSRIIETTVKKEWVTNTGKPAVETTVHKQNPGVEKELGPVDVLGHENTFTYTIVGAAYTN